MLFERYEGYASQQHDGAEDPHCSNNLRDPVAGDHGARGGFDDRAKSFSVELWADTHHVWLVLAGLGLVGAVHGALRD